MRTLSAYVSGGVILTLCVLYVVLKSTGQL